MLVLFAFSASAEDERYYSYEVSNEEATITYVSSLISGDVTIPSTLGGYKVTSISDFAFCDCSNLTGITIPDSVTSIGNEAFHGCDRLTSVTIGDGVTSIGDVAFYDCSKLTYVTIGNSVTDIGYGVFYNCTNLTSVTIPDSVKSISDSAFEGCAKLSSITIGDGVTSIGRYAFAYCSNLTSVTIGANVTSIDHEAFYKCKNLKSVYATDIESWLSINFKGDFTNPMCYAKNIYFGNKLVKNIVIPDGITSINYRALHNFTTLESVTIPNSVTSIGNQAFGGCSNLTSVTIPDSVTSIGSGAFNDCTSLTSITIPDSVTSIGGYAFEDCDSLTSVTIPDSVTHIGNEAFYDCDSLTSVTIGDGVTSIGNEAFFDCYNLTSVTIGDSMTSIGSNAFDSCPIKDVYYTGTKSQWKTITINYGNSALTDATIHYNYCGAVHKNIVDTPQQNPTCTKIGYTAGKRCSHCEEWISGHETIAKLGHSYSSSYTTDKKATLSANGSMSRHCTRDGCTAKTSVTAIPKVSSVTLSATNYIYDGKNKTPTVTIKDANGKKLVKNTDYKLSVASKRSGIGRYTVKVTFIGNYSGTKNVYFYIKTGKPATVKSASQTTSSVKLTWSPVKGASGYTVYRYSPSKKAYVKAGTTEGTSLTVKKLYAGTKYTFRVVSYGKTSGGKVYDSDSYALIKTATKTKTPILSDITAYKGKVKLFWTATSGETGYTIYYSTKKDSGFKKYANYESNSGYVKNLTSGKTYYFKVRTYIKTDSGYVYSDWSNIKGVKVK